VPVPMTFGIDPLNQIGHVKERHGSRGRLLDASVWVMEQALQRRELIQVAHIRNSYRGFQIVFSPCRRKKFFELNGFARGERQGERDFRGTRSEWNFEVVFRKVGSSFGENVDLGGSERSLRQSLEFHYTSSSVRDRDDLRGGINRYSRIGLH